MLAVDPIVWTQHLLLHGELGHRAEASRWIERDDPFADPRVPAHQLPFLIRAATTSLQVASDAKVLDQGPGRSWDDLLTDVVRLCQLDAADEVDQTVST